MRADKSKKNGFLSGIFPVFLFLLFSILPGTFLLAGEYHASDNETRVGGETLSCSQCHTMHGTQGGVSMLYQVRASMRSFSGHLPY